MNPTYEQTRASLILRLQDAEDMAAWDEFATIYGSVVFNVAIQGISNIQLHSCVDVIEEVNASSFSVDKLVGQAQSSGSGNARTSSLSCSID